MIMWTEEKDELKIEIYPQKHKFSYINMVTQI